MNNDIECVFLNTAALATVNQVDYCADTYNSQCDTNMQFDHMDDYCLQTIFKSLTLMDLCSLAESSKRLKQIIVSLFPHGFSIKAVSDQYDKGYYRGYYVESTYFLEFYSELAHIERILQNFGSYLAELSLCRNIGVVNSIAKYCGDATLRRLKIENLQSIEGVQINLRPNVQNLLELSIVDCGLHIFSSADFNCDSLIELEIVSSAPIIKILDHTFNNLQRFTFKHGDNGKSFPKYKTNHLAKFIERHNRLRVLSVCADMVVCCRELLNTIGNNCKELEELSLKKLWCDEPSFEFSSLQSLPHLRKLHVNFMRTNWRRADYAIHIALLQALSSLETLELYFLVDIPARVFDVLPQMHNLRELRLTHFWFKGIPWTEMTQLRNVYLIKPIAKIYFEDFFNAISCMTNLEKVIFGFGRILTGRNLFELTETGFLKIVRMVAQRPNVLTLACRFYFNYSENRYQNARVKLIKPIYNM